MSEWKRIETDGGNDEDGDIWKPENSGEFQIGKYLVKEEGTGTDGKSILYHFENSELESEENPNGRWKVWGTTVLNDLMDKIEIGNKVKLVYQGKQKSKKGNWYKVFEAFVEEGSSSSSSSSTEQSDEDAVNDIIDKGSEDEDMLATGWLNKVTNDMIGEQRTVTEKTLKAEIYNLSQISTKDDDLGTLDMDMAARVFKVIDKKGY